MLLVALLVSAAAPVSCAPDPRDADAAWSRLRGDRAALAIAYSRGPAAAVGLKVRAIATDGGASLDAVSDDKGVAQFQVPAGAYTVVLAEPGLARCERTFTVSPEGGSNG